ncbi:MAG: Asp-tRNA(Asn)/Glu-tRNA(Gln) amidotransferase subunit GatC [Candidatus Latescibacteria bacterium]|nr:Asp-tRNA(Asn)/Glu-tRNA(Gln) amidotransferase subunit GatC [Candidatus Latescibacterota bacterium]
MAVTLDDVRKVAYLSRLSFSAEEEKRLVDELNRILSFMEKLNELNTEGVSPTSHVLPISNVFREDGVVPSLSQDELLANAPSRRGGYFRVPKVIE